MLDIHPEAANWVDLRLSYGMMKGVGQRRKCSLYPADKFIAELKLKKARMNYVYNPYISFVYSNYFEQSEVKHLKPKPKATPCLICI